VDEVRKHLSELTRLEKVEEMVTRPGRSDVVRLMTLHRAKGLEARVVFLADPTDSNPPLPKAWIDRSTDPPRAHVVVERKTGPFSKEEIARPLDWDEKCAREQEFLEREDERLLYVAATRAREALVVSFRKNKNGAIGGPWARLDPYVRRELPRPAAPPPPVIRRGGVGLGHDLEDFRSRRAQRLAAGSVPTYSVTSVTALAHAAVDAAERPFASATGRGMSWGSALHRLLEAAMRDPQLDLPAYAANVLAEEDRPPEDLEDAIAAVEGVRRSALWKRALSAKTCLVEVPFAVTLPVTAEPARPSETILSGAIDLVFEEPAGWVLVDYKSDTISDNLEALVRFYEPQLAYYRRVWRDLSGRPTRAGLFFLHTGQEVWLEE
jgi:ATP-dependent helicase/nuclease subunit A